MSRVVRLGLQWRLHGLGEVLRAVWGRPNRRDEIRLQGPSCLVNNARCTRCCLLDIT